MINTLLTSLLIAVTFLWLSSYTHHTAFGVDRDVEQENRVLHMTYRISWTGHGSVWLGYTSVIRNKDEITPLEKFDLASAILKPVKTTLAPSASLGNRLGFWFIRQTTPKPVLWVGVPSWLPVLLVAGILLLYRRRARLI
ncbi:MAG: hypothetical protein CSB47_10090 [Proteobacteria bacterium]|nr:MAG: hypothetical protein CSB47_10090 [Pseudomonadota bacterium]